MLLMLEKCKAKQSSLWIVQNTNKTFGTKGWVIGSTLVTLLALVPIGVILSSLSKGFDDVWAHILQTKMAELLWNTGALTLGVTLGSLVIGVGLAYLNAFYDYPGKRFLNWALVLPLAFPAYVLAFVHLGIFDFSGPIQTLGRHLLPFNHDFLHFRSRGGLILVMTLALYPYVYLIVRNAFITQGARLLETAHSLGHSTNKAFFSIILPMARPWIGTSLLLVIMETLADFGAVSAFNYDTFTTAVYTAWFGFFSLKTAAQLASILVFIAFLLILLEQTLRIKMRFLAPGRHSQQIKTIKLRGKKRLFASGFSWGIFSFAFLLPMIQLIFWVTDSFSSEWSTAYVALISHTLILGTLCALVVTTLAFILTFTIRQQKRTWLRAFFKISGLGYAMPGTILAIGLFIPTAWFDNLYVHIFSQIIGRPIQPILTGSLIVMVLALTIRFLSPATQTLSSAFERLSKSIDDAAFSLGASTTKTISKIYIPLLSKALLTAFLIITIDTIKEMPITLMTRPFAWNTLSVKIYELTSEGEWSRAALPALFIVLLGLFPTYVMIRSSNQETT
jgi:iron(III) transport system permease protein